MNNTVLLTSSIVAVTSLAVALLLGVTSVQSDATKGRASYVALGDSIATGTGAVGEDGACGINEGAYPAIVASKTGMDGRNVACNGATIPFGLVGSQLDDENVLEPQLDQIGGEKPDVITLTVGANDMKWSRFLACYERDCGTSDDKKDFARAVKQYEVNLRSFFSRLSEKYEGMPPPVFATGYFQVVPRELADCDELDGISSDELAWARGTFDEMNRTIQTVARSYPFVTYVPINFTGHELCTDDPWIQPFDGPSPRHPNAQGQEEYARSIVEAMRNKGGDAR